MTLTRLALIGAGFTCGALELMNEMTAQRDCLLQRLHRIGVARNALVAEEIRRRTSRKHEVIVGDLTVLRDQHAPILIDTKRLRHKEIDIVVVLEELACGVGDLRRREYSRTHLIEQRLEQMIIMPIHKRDANVFLGKFLGETHAPESGSDDDHMLLIRHNDPTPYSYSEKNHIVWLSFSFEKKLYENISPHGVHHTTFYRKFNRIFRIEHPNIIRVIKCS